MRPRLALLAVACSVTAVTAAGPTDWPGFRGPGMTATMNDAKIPATWSRTSNVAWSADIAGNGWSSPIVWRDTVYLTSAISGKPFKEPTPGLYGNDYIAELRAQGLSNEEVSRRVRARDNETPEESDAVSYRVMAIDAASGKVKWEREAFKGVPHGGRHRKNTYASETPFTDGERLYVSFGQNVGMFAFTLDGTPLWRKTWEPRPIYLDFGTASSPVVHDGKVLLLHDNEQQSFLLALDAKTGIEAWRTERPRAGFLNSAWNTPFIWKHNQRTEIVTTGHGFILSYDLQGRELWRIALTGITMPTPSAFADGGLLFVGTGSQQDGANRPFFAVRPGAAGDITLKEGESSNTFIAWHQSRASGYTPSGIAHGGRIYLVHDIGILAVYNAGTGKELYKARIGGGGQTFSASPVAAGNHLFFLNEDGETFVLEAGDHYKEVARNDLDEMSLASPAIAGDAMYIRTRTKLYKIAAAPRAADEAVFAGGCYWGVEAVFEHVRGVSSAVSGFSDGVESVQLRFDPSVVSYRELLEVFFTVAHDPTSRDRQGPDAGRQYRAIVFHRNAAQRAAAETYLGELRSSARFARPIVTELSAFRAFRAAPPGQQDYAARHPGHPYIVTNDLPKIERLRREFPQLFQARVSPSRSETMRSAMLLRPAKSSTVPSTRPVHVKFSPSQRSTQARHSAFVKSSARTVRSILFVSSR